MFNEDSIHDMFYPLARGSMSMKKPNKCRKTKDLFAYAEDNRASVVYRATNTVTGDFYIGITRCSMAERKRAHKGAAAKGVRGRFYNAIRKYGFDAFLFEEVARCASYKEAQSEEIRLIAEQTPAYNITAGGQGCIGYRHPPEELERMRQRALGNKGYWLGKQRDMATCKKISDAKLKNPQRYWLGKKRDPETIRKITEKNKGRQAPFATPRMIEQRAINFRTAAANRRRAVVCVETDIVFESGAAASEWLCVDKAAISEICRGGRKKTIHGLRFAFAEVAP